MFRPVFHFIRNIYIHFDTLPKAVDLENSRFYTVANVAQTLAWMAHLTWFIVLQLLGVTELAWFQLFSILCYVVAIVANRRGQHTLSMVISLTEIVAHQVIAVKYLGADAGFQIFIPVVGIFPFLIPRGSLLVKSGMLLVSAIGYLYIEQFLVGEEPVYTISEMAMIAFRVSNIIMGFGFIALWAFYLNIAIYRAEVILSERTRELALSEQKAEQEKMLHDLAMKERDNEIFRLRNIELKESYDAILEKNRQIEEEKNKSRKLLLNILPEETAGELMNEGKASTRRYESATVIFADFVGFTRTAAVLSPEELVKQIDVYFTAFDEIMQRHNIEKIKTIGDAYMAVGGLPAINSTHAHDVLNAAKEMLTFAASYKSYYKYPFDLRIGIHTGSLVAGVVGNHKFQYDIWGDAVNIAARMEQNSEPGRINISGATYALVKDKFAAVHRGKIEAKNRGEIDMYFVE